MNLGEPIARGNAADIYLSGGRAVKLFHGWAAAGESEREAQKQRLARSCGLPVPAVLEVLGISGRQALVMEYIPGPTLGELAAHSARQAGRCLELSMELQLRIHRTNSPLLRSAKSMEKNLIHRLQAARGLEERQRTALLGQLREMTPLSSPGLCHGDLHLLNLGLVFQYTD